MDDSFTKERLERALANMEWFSRFQSVMVKTLVARTSDHSPILISFCDEAPKQQTSARPLSWNAKGVIQSAWENDVLGGGGSSMQAVQRWLSSCQQALTSWSWRIKNGNKGRSKIGFEMETGILNFHSWENHRRKINSIQSISDEVGRI
jgi:hypothetical protein